MYGQKPFLALDFKRLKWLKTLRFAVSVHNAAHFGKFGDQGPFFPSTSQPNDPVCCPDEEEKTEPKEASRIFP